MVLQNSIIIQLDKYGVEGYVAVGYPSLRKIKLAEQTASSLMLSFDKSGKPTVNAAKGLEADLIVKVLVYIEEAPFALMNADAFFDFTDELDAKCRGAGQALYDELVDAVKRINEGEVSPSPDSQAAETVSSA